MVEVELQELQREARSLRYVDAGAGEPLVFVHGWCSDHHSFDRQVAHFAASHRVIVPDLQAGMQAQIDLFAGPRREADGPAWLRAGLFGPHDDPSGTTSTSRR